jgi:large subunit ribosomal protein L9
MKIILQKTVERLGDPGDVAEVADGYARNYLIPRGLAVKAEKGTVRHAESLKRAHEVRTSAQKGDYEALAARIIQTPVVVTARAGEEGKLFGSVTAADIAEALSAQAGVPVDRRNVHLAEPIRSIGTHEVIVHLHPEVDPVITVDVQPVDGQPPAAPPRDVQPKEEQPPDVQHDVPPPDVQHEDVQPPDVQHEDVPPADVQHKE